MKAFRLFYTIWGVFWFWAVLLLLFPAFLTLIFIPSLRHYTQSINRLWAYVVYGIIFMPVKTVWEFKPKKGQSYVFCPNHTSYLDIPLIGHTGPGPLVFMGKESLSKVPVFGYMFRHLHIPVNRKKMRSRYDAYFKAKEALMKKWSVLLFPEGSINPKPPGLARFKDGPFRLAIETQTPIVPVTIPYHWIVFHDKNSLLRWHKIEIIYHRPIETNGMTLEDINTLKQQVFETILGSLQHHFPEKVANNIKSKTH